MIAIRLTLVSFLVCGLLYPLAITGLAQLLFPRQANGSLISGSDGRKLGSKLIGQRFEGPAWFQGRPSGVDYKAESSGAGNLGPTSRKLVERVKADVARVRAENPTWGAKPIPSDLVAESGSGLDPHISPESARLQAPRVALARNLSPGEVLGLVAAHTEGPAWGLFGPPRVNVLELNLSLGR